jgi:hypothetical protein
MSYEYEEDVNGSNQEEANEDRMVDVMTRLARDLEKVLIGIGVCAGLLALIAFIMLVRTAIGR